MTGGRIEQLLWIVTIVVGVAGVVSASVMEPQPQSVASTISRARDLQKTISRAASASDEERAIHAGDVFRRERSLPDVMTSPPPPTTQPPAQPKPRLALRGLVGGPPWNAVLEGVPGHDGSYVVSTGDTVAGLKIRSVQRHGVIIRGMDTTWSLELGRQRSP